MAELGQHLKPMVALDKYMQDFSVEKSRKWDFRRANTNQYTHCFHTYPAMMVPQMARKLIKNYGIKGGLLFDPYCGTGTSLVESKIFGMDSIGTDLNPAARFIAECKTKDYDFERIKATTSEFLDRLDERLSMNVSKRRGSCVYGYLTRWKNIIGNNSKVLKEWYSLRTIKEICITIEEINMTEDIDSQNLQKLALSECFRLVSYQRNNEFKKYKMKSKHRNKFYEKLFPLLRNRLNRNLRGIRAFSKVSKKRKSVEINSFNTVDGIPKRLLNKVDMILTSPPYGDSRTTVAYGEYSWHTNLWFNLGSTIVDPKLMGGRSNVEIRKTGHKGIDSCIKKIDKADMKRARDVYKFYTDYLKSIENVSITVKKNGHVCYLVGNRTVKGLNLPTDQFTAWAFIKNGFSHVKTIARTIPTKRMPYRVSPTNIKGQTEATMTKEYIVIMKKS